MLDRLKVELKKMWCHRASYAGLACASGAACYGVDAVMVKWVMFALYTSLVFQRH